MFEVDRRMKMLTLGAMCFALFMTMLDNTVVNVAGCSGSSTRTPSSSRALC